MALFILFGEEPRGSTFRSLDDLRGQRAATLKPTFAYDLLVSKGFDPASYGLWLTQTVRHVLP